MTSLEVKDVVAEYIRRVWNEGDFTAFERLSTPDFVYRLGGQTGRDRTGMRRFITALHTAFPDWQVEIDILVAEGDTVAVGWHGGATHRGAFHGIPATGRRVRVTGINLYRVTGGRIASEWEETDSVGLLQQLGVLPPVPQPEGAPH